VSSRAQVPAAAVQPRSAAVTAPAPRRRLTGAGDALGQIARALAVECDLRGLDA
jgi:hypothetical protein